MSHQPSTAAPTQPKPQIESQSAEFDRAMTDLGRAFVVYFAWKSVGLLDRSENHQK